MLKGLFLLVLAVVLAALACEGLARLAYRGLEHRPFDVAAIDARKRQLIGEAKALEVTPDHKAQGTLLALHPYLGFVYDPSYDPPGMLRQHGLPVSSFGFLDDKEPVQAGAKDEVIVGLFGGSMAWWVSREGGDALIAELARIPELRGKKIVLVRAALGGMKQPQQLMALSYLLSLGAHFDIAINLDGFDEVALAPNSNVKHGVNPFYPSPWDRLVGGLEDPTKARFGGEIAAFTRLRGEWAEIFLLPGLRSSAIATLVWRAVDGTLGDLTSARRLDLAEQEGQLDPDQGRFASRGPKLQVPDDGALYADLARMWKDGSLQMERLSRGNGIHYYHFLQPNQYFPGSKPLGEEERKVAVRDGSDSGKSVAQGYPLLRDAARELTREGVRFEDLTGIFSGMEEPLYIDDCCHVNPTGNAMIGKRMGELVAQDFATERREHARRDEPSRATGSGSGESEAREPADTSAPAEPAPPPEPEAQPRP